jgi:hypothetical protein
MLHQRLTDASCIPHHPAAVLPPSGAQGQVHRRRVGGAGAVGEGGAAHQAGSEHAGHELALKRDALLAAVVDLSTWHLQTHECNCPNVQNELQELQCLHWLAQLDWDLHKEFSSKFVRSGHNLVVAVSSTATQVALCSSTSAPPPLPKANRSREGGWLRLLLQLLVLLPLGQHLPHGGLIGVLERLEG